MCRSHNIIPRLRVLLGLSALLLASNYASAQVTNAFDTVTNYTVKNWSENKGYGFGPWVLNHVVGGGYYLDPNSVPPFTAFALWNDGSYGSTTANRSLNLPLSVGGTFSVQIKNQNLNLTTCFNKFDLQDAGGNILFSLFWQGNVNADAMYSDASVTGGAATGFTFNANNFSTYVFTLTSPTTYTMADTTTSKSISGTLSGAPITQFTFERTNSATYSGGGQDFKFNNPTVTSLSEPAPIFTVQPQSQTAMMGIGATISLSAYATSSKTVNYQWYKANAPLSGKTATNLDLSNLSMTDAGSYYAVASNSFGSSTSWVAVVTIDPFAFTNAFDSVANYTGNDYFGNQGYGFGTWVLSSPGGGHYLDGTPRTAFALWNMTPNAASTANRPFSSPLAVGQTFSVQLKNQNLLQPTSVNKLNLQDASGNVVFSLFWSGTANADAQFTDAAHSDAEPGAATGFTFNANNFSTYLFTLNSSTTYTFTDKTTGASFTGTLAGSPITQVTFVRANTGSGALNSQGQDYKFNNLVITSPTVPSPVFSVQPQSQEAMVGTTVNLTTLALSTQPVSYQWYKGTAPLSGKTSTNLVLANVGSIDGAGYWVVAANSYGSSTSSVAVVTIVPFAYTNAFDTSTNYTSIMTGNQGYGFGPWACAGNYPINGGFFDLWNFTIFGSSTANRTFNSPLTVGGKFSVLIKNHDLTLVDNYNGFNLLDSSSNTLVSLYWKGNVNADAQYTDASVTGMTATGFTFNSDTPSQYEFTLNSPTTYTFKDKTTGASFNGTLSGAPITQVTFFRSNTGPDNNPNGGQDFRFDNLTITSATVPPPIFTVQPFPTLSGPGGSSFMLTSLATSLQTVNYQWYKANLPMAGMKSANLVLANVSQADIGSYYVVASNTLGSATSIVSQIYVYYGNSSLLAYEGFDYNAYDMVDPLATPQNGGLGWTNAWQNIWNSAMNIAILPSSLIGDTNVQSGFDSRSTGNALYNSGGARTGRFLDCSASGTFAKRGFLDASGHIGADGKTVYISFLEQPSATATFYEFEFHRDNLGDGGRIGGIGNDVAGGTDVNLRAPNGTFRSLGAGDTTVNFYIVRIDFKSGNDDIYVYRNPTSLAEPGTPTLTAKGVSDLSFDGISVGAGGSVGVTVTVDEIRIGSAWTDVYGSSSSNFLPPTKTAQGQRVQFAATPGFTYHVLRTTDLTNGTWTDLGTVVAPDAGLCVFDDANPPAKQAFYRTVVQ